MGWSPNFVRSTSATTRPRIFHPSFRFFALQPQAGFTRIDHHRSKATPSDHRSKDLHDQLQQILFGWRTHHRRRPFQRGVDGQGEDAEAIAHAAGDDDGVHDGGPFGRQNATCPGR